MDAAPRGGARSDARHLIFTAAEGNRVKPAHPAIGPSDPRTVNSSTTGCAAWSIGGYWWSDSSLTAAVRETEARLRVAFNDGPTATRDWLNLMIWNNPQQALAQCHGDSVLIQGGRRARMVPLWIEEPVSPLPQQAGE